MSAVDQHRAAHAAFNGRDWAEVVKDFAPDAIYTDHPRGLTLNGPDEFRAWLQAWVASFSDGRVADVRYIDGGQHSVALYRGRGRNDGPLGPFPATGKTVDVPFCEVLHFDAQGRIVGGEVLYDQATLLIQLGHLEAPPG